jgi:exopolysaccharide biosynthesis operon protein EpsL
MFDMCVKHFRGVARRSICLFCFVQIFCGSNSFADELDVVNLKFGSQSTTDNNLFRLPDAVDPSTLGISGHERADTITTLNFGLQVDKPLGQQKIHLEAIKSANRYKNYGNLNSNTSNYNTYWQWSFTPELSGRLFSERQQSAQGFANIQTYSSQNITTADSQRFDADWSPLHSFHLLTALSKRKSTNSQLYNQDQSNKISMGEGGGRYVFTSGASISVLYDTNVGTYLNQILDSTNQIDTGFRQKEYKFALAWPFSGKSRVDVQLGKISRKHDNFSSRDYSGNTRNISYSGDLTSQLHLTASTVRTYNPYVETNNSYYLNDAQSIQLLWQMKSKLGLKLRLDAYKNDFRGPLPGVTVLNPRIDKGDSRLFEVDWVPFRALTVIGSVSRDQRNSTITGWMYNDNIVSVSLQAKF